ncbi:hypothetical protein K466DRAFT_604804 [Polyporus arcularius HHB13444]|uniref:Uncharacterized protein n=1 Tax=Polyporus arcularius HHB13444 TaxID=1314778 RepID=A0A5C3NYG7_9APHY|nr:hypothetical protein K466DRAFT_604804 [Polyporus arcularius HHB13444]
MGRKAIYFTLEEKKAAKRLQAQAYRRSEKGKQTKAAANLRHHEEKKGLVPPRSTSTGLAPAEASTALADASRAVSAPVDSPLITTIDWFVPEEWVPGLGEPDAGADEATASVPGVVDIPDDLFDRAQNDLRASFGAVHGSGPLLGLWTPPYRFTHAEEDVTYLLLPNIRSDDPRAERRAVLGAFQCCAVLAAARDRRERWTTLSVEELEVEVQSEIAARVDAWRILRDSAIDGSWSDDVDIALDWGAKIVDMLAEEWECRLHGTEQYTQLIRSRDMPWQRLVSDIMSSTSQ